MAVTDRETRLIRALRLRAQGLVTGVHDWCTAPDVARGMLAMQAQDGAAARFALSLRAAERPDDAAVAADLAQRRIVRNRPSRGTLQVTAPEDLHWLSSLLTRRSQADAIKRRPQLGITDDLARGVEDVVRTQLAGGVTRTRPELIEACAGAGFALDSMQAGHLLRHLTEMMAIVFAESTGKVDTFALADDWITDRRQPDHALGETVTRFVAARGPVTRQDIGKWGHLAMGSVDEGIEAASERIEKVRLAGTDYLVAKGAADIDDAEVDEALAAPLLLPGFDEYILGYGSRTPLLDERFFDRIVPGRNGIFKPLVVVDGEIVGTWSRKATAKKVTITVEPFTTITAATIRRLAGPARAYGTFLGLDVTLA